MNLLTFSFSITSSNISSTQQLVLLMIAMATGFIAAFMGIGGGLIIVPTLTIVFDVPIHEAIAASIVGVVATSISSASSYIRQKMTNIRLALFLETSTTLGALTGALLALITPASLLYFMFALFAFYVSFSQAYSARKEVEKLHVGGFKRAAPDALSRYLHLSGRYFDLRESKDIEYVVRGSIKGWLLSFLAGMGSAMLGIGGGFIKVSAMNMFMNVPFKAAVATSKFMIGFTAATGAIVYYVAGIVRPQLVAPVATGTISGAFLGTLIMNKVRVKWLKLAFSCLTLYIGYSMLKKGLLYALGVVLP